MQPRPPAGRRAVTFAALCVVMVGAGWLGRDLWNFAVEMLELYREQR